MLSKSLYDNPLLLAEFHDIVFGAILNLPKLIKGLLSISFGDE